MKEKILIVCGPTASGKTALAVDIAKKYNGEVNLKYEDGHFTVEVMMIMRKGARKNEG